MSFGILIMTHAMFAGLTFAIGRWLGFCDAQPKRDRRGRFIKR